MAQKIDNSMSELDFEKEKKPFLPYITLARGDKRPIDSDLESAKAIVETIKVYALRLYTYLFYVLSYI